MQEELRVQLIRSPLLRQATSTDLTRITEIERLSFATPWPREYLAQQLGHDGFVVAEHDGQTVGYTVVGVKIPSLITRLERRTWAFLSGHEPEEPPPVGHVLNVAVDPAFRGHGFGKRLLEHALEYVRTLGADRVELEVRTDNNAAIALYERFGFEIRELFPRYYSDGEDAFLMVKNL